MSDEHTTKSTIVPDIHGPDLEKQERDGKNSLLRCYFNPLNPYIKKEILICCPYTFSMVLMARSC